MTFGAFHAEPDDSTAPWSKRFPKKRTLMLNVSRKHVTWRILDKNGVLGQPGSMEGELKEILPQMAPEWRELTDGGWCSISLNHRFVVSLESNLPRRKALEDVLRTNPKAGTRPPLRPQPQFRKQYEPAPRLRGGSHRQIGGSVPRPRPRRRASQRWGLRHAAPPDRPSPR